MWSIIAEAGSVDELQNSFPLVDDLPPGTEILIHVDLVKWAPIGKLANIAGAEWWSQRLAPENVLVTDVSGDWTTIEIRGVVHGTPVLIIIAVIVAALSLLGVAYYVSRIYVSANIVEQTKADIARNMINSGYSADQVRQVLDGIKTATPNAAVVGGVSLAAIAAGLAAVILLSRR